MPDFLRPPHFDDPELNERAAIVWATVLLGLLAVVAHSIVQFLPGMSGNPLSVLFEVAVFVFAMLAVRRGYVQAPAIFMIASFMGVVTTLTFFGGGIEYAFPPLLGTLAVMGGLMLGPRVGLALTVWAVLCLLVVSVTGSSDLLIEESQDKRGAIFLIQFVTVFFGGSLVTYSTFRLSRALVAERLQTANALESAERLERSRKLNEDMIQSMIDAVLLTGPDGRIRNANDAAVRMFAVGTADAMVGQPLHERLDRHDLEHLDHADTLGSMSLGEGTVRTAHETIPVRIARSTVIDETGASLELFVLADIRQRVEAQRRSEQAARDAEQASRAKSQFLANMSHELRTPLNAVIGYSDMLLEEVDDAEVVADVTRIRQAGNHLLSLINDVLDMSKIEAGRMDIHLEPVDLPSLIASAHATVEPAAHDRGNQIQLHITDSLPQIHTDGRKLSQILLNLLSNGVKFTENGTVTLTVEPVDTGYIQIRISDTGIGIEPDKLERLFQPFVQGDDSTQRKYGGTGLGLALSRRFAQMLGGTLEAASQHGEGATFTLLLPIGRIHRQEAQPSTESGTGPLVLCVDDDPLTLDLFGRLLRREGLRVATATNGPDALDMAQRHVPNVITLDVMMPEMDGWMLLQRLRKDPRLRAVPVVMVSMVDDGVSSALGLGASDYLVKPVMPNVMMETIHRYLASGIGNVLIVDDIDDTRKLLERLLTGEGWGVATADSGPDALRSLKASPPDLIILDPMLPGMGGFGFIEAVRDDPELTRIPIVVHTARELSSEQWEQLQNATEHVVRKGDNGLHRVLQEVRRFAVQAT